MANENSVPADITTSAPLVSPAPEPTGNPLDNPRLAAVINRATGQPQPVDPTLPIIQPVPLNPPAPPITLPDGTEYQDAGGPVALLEGTEYYEAPKNLTEAHALGQPFNPITDFDANGLADAAKQKAFNLVDLYMQSPLEVQQDPAIRDKVADAFMQVWQYSEKHPLEGISVGSVAKAIGHLGKGIFDWAKNHVAVIGSAIKARSDTGTPEDEKTATTKAAENILELQLAGTQLGYQGEDLAKWLARRVFKENIVKPLSDYSPEDKDKALQDEIDRRHLTQRILSGKTLERVDKEGLPINSEKIASMAGADPLQFLAFEGAGAVAKGGLKVVGKVAPELAEAGQMVTDLASKAAPKIAGTVIKGVGKAAEVAAKPVEFAAKGAESTVGEYLAAHLLGPPGVLAAKAIGKAGKALPKIAKAGTNLGEQLTEGVTSNTAQAVKDIMEAAPYSLKDILSGAAYDAAFSAAAKSPEEREGIGLGTALGLGGGLSRMAIHGIGGQLVGERADAFTPKDAQVFHDTYNTGYEHHQFTDPVSAQFGLEKLGLSPEQAKDFSQKRGGTFENANGKFTYAVGADATPHEPVHAWKKSLPAEEQARLDKETRSRYSDEEFQQIKDQYASALDKDNFNGKNADEILAKASPGESADSYTINEIQAENLMTALKAGEGKGLLHKAAKIAAGALSAAGVEPLASRQSQSEVLQFPLKHKEVQGLKSALEASKPPGGEGIAQEKAAARNVEGLAEKFPDKAAAIGTLGEAQARGTGVKLTYSAAPGETPADVQSASPLAGRKARATAVESARELPEFARQPWWKTFFPDRTFTTKKGKLQTGGWAPEIFRANAHGFAKEAAPHDQMRAVSPYEIDKSTAFYTPDAWKQLTADVQTAVKNWRDGRTASGTPVVVPEELTKQSGGQIYQPRVGPGGGPLDQAKADFISHLMGHQLPETPRLAKSFPLNVAGQDVSAATIPGRVVGPSRGEFGTYGQSPAEVVSQRERAESMGVQGRQLLEVNPFRLKLDAAAKAAGVKSPRPLSVYQKLNHERILSIQHAPGEPEFRGNTLTQAAGFEPAKVATREGRAPNNEVRSNAEDYMRITGRPHQPHSDNVPANEALGKKVADWYESATHAPDSPEVKESYDALANETLDQYNHLVSKGVKFDAWRDKGQPYKDSADMMKDVRDNKHLWYFPTDAGYGAGEKISHPMLEQVTLPNGEKAPVNDLFRAVHDYYGHAKEGYKFGPRGEYNAFLAHSRMYSDAAQPAMASETMGQNSWVNFGPHLRNAEGEIPKKGEAGYVPQTDRRFSDQKALAMPKDLLHASKTPQARFEPATKAGREAEKKGYKLERVTDNYGASRYSFWDTDGHEISHLQIVPDEHQPGKLAHVEDIVTATAHRRQGLAEALYREAGADMQRQGVRVLTGTTMSDAPRSLREKVFGPPLKDNRYPVQSPETDIRNTYSAIRPGVQFEPPDFEPGKDLPDRLPGEFWVRKGGKIIPANAGHYNAAIDNGLVDSDFKHPLEMENDTSPIYPAAMKNGHMRGISDGFSIYLDGHWGKTGGMPPFESLTRSEKQMIEDLAYKYNKRIVYNGRSIDIGPKVPGARFEPPSNFNTKDIAKDIREKAKASGGFIYNPYTRTFLTTGYATSIYPEKEISRILEPKELTKEILENFIEDQKHLLTRAENSVGGWLDPESGKLYLDVAFTTPSRPLAEFAGREYNQKAVGDLAKYAAGENGDIPTGGTGEPIEDMAPAHKRVEELMKDFDWEQPDLFGARPQQELMPGIGTRSTLSSKDIGDMTKAELMNHFPESIVPKRRKDMVGYDIKDAPRWKGKDNPTDIAADSLEKFARDRLASKEFQDGLKWYSEFVPMLKKAYGKHGEMMAQLLAATSPRNSPTPNFALANDAIEGYKSGRFDKQIKKYLDGAKMLDSATWKSWYAKQNKAGKLVSPRDNPSEAAFMAEWIDAHNLAPRQSNGKLYGMHSVPVLQVMAGKWLTENTGPKTLQFVKNLLGVHHGATIDVWAARTMRRLGHEGISDRWRILPGNEAGVSDSDFAFSQEAFAKAASRIGVKPDALQGALWFAEKKLWAERGWGRLDFGDFRKEIAKREMLNQGIKTRLAESSAPATEAAKQESLLDFVTPRNER